jgi:hypothetical protein
MINNFLLVILFVTIIFLFFGFLLFIWYRIIREKIDNENRALYHRIKELERFKEEIKKYDKIKEEFKDQWLK